MNLYLKIVNKSQRYEVEVFLYMVPFIGLFFSCGFYNWLLIIFALILIYYNRVIAILLLIPLYVVFLICIAIPVNAFLRCMLLTIISMLFLNLWCYYVIYKEKMRKLLIKYLK